MSYTAEFQFFLKVLKNLNIPVRIFSASDANETKIIDLDGLDIYAMLYPDMPCLELYQNLVRVCPPAAICRLYDKWFCNYVLFQLPETPEASYVMIGPYTKTPIIKEDILHYTEQMHLSPAMYMQVEQFYQNLICLADPSHLTVLLNTLGESLWGSLESFIWKDLDSANDYIFPFSTDNLAYSTQDDPAIQTKKIEEIYQAESDFLQAVTLGQAHKAEMILQHYTVLQFEKRTADPIRNIKNYSIVLNTLLRKAVEKGGVHPIHIDKLSSMYAKQIELRTTADSLLHLHQEMVHKYCLLVKNFSLKSYSPLVKKVLTNIDADITADLSLKKQAELLNINASYLSALFKKETGTTLTDYVNRRRTTHAVMLLNATTMQIQMIAQYCGIPDVNYFTKLFKKYIGMTPQEYRRNISAAPAKE